MSFEAVDDDGDGKDVDLPPSSGEEIREAIKRELPRGSEKKMKEEELVEAVKSRTGYSQNLIMEELEELLKDGEVFKPHWEKYQRI